MGLFRRFSYGEFVASQSFSPSDPSVVEGATGSIWRISRNGNYWREWEGDRRVTVCHSKRSGDIGYVWNIGDDKGWKGPFGSFDEAMEHADAHIFDGLPD